MIASIQEELAIHVSIALKDHQHQLGSGEQCGVIRRRSRGTAGKTSRFKVFRALFRPVVRNDFGGPRQHVGCVLAASSEPVPDSREVRVTVRHTRHGSRGTLASTPSTGVASTLSRSSGWILRRGTQHEQTQHDRRCDHWFGAPSPPDDPANTLRPSGNLTLRAFAVLEPSFAIEPSTVTWSPAFSESFLQPCFSSTGMAPSSKFQLVTFPLASLTST